MASAATIVRWGGVLSILGGIGWIRFGSLLAARPPGSPMGPYRLSHDLLPWLGISLLLIVIGSAGLHFQPKGYSGALGATGWAIGFVGALLVVVGAWRAGYGDDPPIIPLFLIPGYLSLVAGFLIAGIAILRRKTLPRWVGGLLILAALTLLAFNDQHATIWTIAPFGVLWIVLGAYSLWSSIGQANAIKQTRG